MFVDDTKLYSNISTSADCEALQDGLNKLAVRSKTFINLQCHQMCSSQNKTKAHLCIHIKWKFSTGWRMVDGVLMKYGVENG